MFFENKAIVIKRITNKKLNEFFNIQDSGDIFFSSSESLNVKKK